MPAAVKASAEGSAGDQAFFLAGLQLDDFDLGEQRLAERRQHGDLAEAGGVRETTPPSDSAAANIAKAIDLPTVFPHPVFF